MPPRIAFGGLKIACKKYAIFYLSNELNNNMIGSSDTLRWLQHR